MAAKAVQVKNLKHAILLGGCFREDGAHQGLFGVGRWRIEDGNLLNSGELAHHIHHTKGLAGLVEPAAQEIEDHQSQDTGEGVHAQLLVSPVEGGSEAEVAGILQATEVDFDVVLGTIGEEDLFFRPVLFMIGEEDSFA